VRVLEAIPLSKGCRCNFDYIRGVLARFGAEERAEMVDEDGFISVDCEFCSRFFRSRSATSRNEAGARGTVDSFGHCC
jgi:redox-regulated HSP33 family molecular chaperone